MLGSALVAATAFGFTRGGDHNPPAPIVEIGAVAAPRTNESLTELIARLQTRLQTVPDDGGSWALLGLAYVQQAKLTVDPSYYPRADEALARSIALDGDDNFLAFAGLSALASARHDFDAAKTYAERGLAINAYSAVLHGALGDAELQLGNYDAAFEAVQRMVDLSPDTSSLSRASYTWELRGDVATATELMQRALDDAPTPADEAFALVHLGELAFNAGDPNLCGARSPGAAPVAGRRNGSHRCDAGAPVGRRGVHPAAASGAIPHRRMIYAPAAQREPLRVLGYATNGVADELALAMLGHLLDDLPVALQIAATRLQASELLSLVQARGSRSCASPIATQPVVKDALSGQEAPRGVSRIANPRRALGTFGAGGREHAGAAGYWSDSRGLDAAGNQDVPRRGS